MNCETITPAAKPGKLLKNQILIHIDRPASLEADTATHCGGSLNGDFVCSITYTAS